MGISNLNSRLFILYTMISSIFPMWEDVFFLLQGMCVVRSLRFLNLIKIVYDHLSWGGGGNPSSNIDVVPG